MFVLFVLGLFVLPSAAILLVATRASRARAQPVRPRVRDPRNEAQGGLTLRNREPTGG